MYEYKVYECYSQCFGNVDIWMSEDVSCMFGLLDFENVIIFFRDIVIKFKFECLV